MLTVLLWLLLLCCVVHLSVLHQKVTAVNKVASPVWGGEGGEGRKGKGGEGGGGEVRRRREIGSRGEKGVVVGWSVVGQE